MRILHFTMILALSLSASAAWGQQPTIAKPKASSTEPTSIGHVTPTPEMWFYDQELRQRYSPELAVRRKAEFETEQRMRRMAAREWFGIDNSRPIANPTPHIGGSYSPMWTGGGRNPYHWAGRSHGATYVVPTTRPIYQIY
jgi:hypothetical protein